MFVEARKVQYANLYKFTSSIHKNFTRRQKRKKMQNWLLLLKKNKIKKKHFS